MKILRSYIAAAIITVACAAPALAQTASDIPASVTTAFTAKYPDAQVKKWSFENNTYTAKAVNKQGKFLASFNSNGAWQQTSSTIRWSWKLPAEISTAIRNSKYSDWKIDGIRKVESPSANYYQLCVDNHFLQADGAHADVFTDNKVLNFNTDGQLVAVKSIESPALF